MDRIGSRPGYHKSFGCSGFKNSNWIVFYKYHSAKFSAYSGMPADVPKLL